MYLSVWVQNNAMLRRKMTVKVFWLSITFTQKRVHLSRGEETGKARIVKDSGLFIWGNGKPAAVLFTKLIVGIRNKNWQYVQRFYMLQCINTTNSFRSPAMNFLQTLPLLAVVAAFALRFYLSRKAGGSQE